MTKPFYLTLAILVSAAIWLLFIRWEIVLGCVTGIAIAWSISWWMTRRIRNNGR